MLALIGFGTIIAFLYVILTNRMSVLTALVLIPMVAGIVAGAGPDLGKLASSGLLQVAPVGIMLMFAVLYFGLMLDVGIFEPLIRSLLSFVKGDPVRLCIITAVLPILIALDGEGATIFLISVTALLPVHRRLGLNPLVLPGIVGLAAGVMNILPWGGPTARAMSVLNADVNQVFLPLLPAMAGGLVWVLVVAWIIGRGERKRLGLMPPFDIRETDGAVSPPAVRPRLFFFNITLTVLLLAALLSGKWPLHLLFMSAFALALVVNFPSWNDQKEQLVSHAKSVVTVTSMIFAAGMFTGILTGTGMIKAMADVMVQSLPAPLVPHLSTIVAVTSMPFSLLFTPDAYYFGVLPIFAAAATNVGLDPVTIGRAALLGQMTTGFPLSPLTASTFILIGLTNVSLGDHQRFLFKWAFGSTLVMTAVALLTGAI